MSTGSLLDFCNKLHDTMNSKRGSQLYRNLVANKRTHVFRFNALDMADQMKKALENDASFDGLTQADRQVINTEAKEMRKTLGKNLETLVRDTNRKGFNLKYKKSTNMVSIKFDVNAATNNIITLGSGRVIEFAADDVFSKVKSYYRPALSTFFNAVQDHLKSTVKVNPKSGRMINRSMRTKGGSTRKGAGRVFHAGHEKGAGIFESFMRDVFEGIASSTNLDTGATQKDLESLGMTSLLYAVRNDAEDSHTIGIESAYLNTQGEGGGVSVSKLRATLLTQLKTAIAQLEKAQKYGVGLSGLEGSDSINTKKKKKAVTKVINAFVTKQASKSLTVKVKNGTGEPKASTGRAKKKRQAKLTKASATGIAFGAGSQARRVKRDRKVTEGPSSSPLRLIAEFNRQLPTVVRKNMTSPRLNNRTGRFADSVKVENIIQTPKGFPSVGYSYQRDPYQVFEEGMGAAPWANGNRDPRDLIDKSVREIAAAMALGRFYTRRV